MSTITANRASSVQAFFDDLATRAIEPRLHQVTGTLEWNVDGAGRWWVTVKRGVLRISRSPHQADCILSCNVGTFLAIVNGEHNLVAAGLRGTVKAAGDLGLGLSFQRLLPDGR
jgi:predicted lipid carrier protein YhbT